MTRHLPLLLTALLLAACQTPVPATQPAPASLGALDISRTRVIDENSGFAPAYVSGPRPAPASAAKLKALAKNVTLLQIVAALGPGWINGNSSTGGIEWQLDNGTEVFLSPSSYAPNTKFTFNGKHFAEVFEEPRE